MKCEICDTRLRVWIRGDLWQKRLCDNCADSLLKELGDSNQDEILQV